jgi:hypothetical protein
MMRCTKKTSCFLGSAYNGIAPVAEVVPSAGRRADYSQRASEYHSRAGLIPVDDKAARTTVNTLGKNLGCNYAARGTFLTRSTTIHGNGELTSIRSFVSHEKQEKAPGGILDRLGEFASGQASEIQTLKTNEVEMVDKISTLPVDEITTLFADTLMEASNAPNSFLAVPTSLDLARQPPLAAFQRSFGGTEEAGVSDLLAVTQGGKGFESYVDTDALPKRNLRCDRLAVINNDLSIPSRSAANHPQKFLLDGNGLIASAKANQSKFRNGELIAGSDIGTGSKVLQRVIARMRAEAGESRFLSCFDAPKECLHGTIKSTERIAGKDSGNSNESRYSLAQSGQPLALLNERDGFLPAPVGFGSLLQGTVVKPATTAEPTGKRLFLSSG